jgi:hypothetical protein
LWGRCGRGLFEESVTLLHLLALVEAFELKVVKEPGKQGGAFLQNPVGHLLPVVNNLVTNLVEPEEPFLHPGVAQASEEILHRLGVKLLPQGSLYWGPGSLEGLFQELDQANKVAQRITGTPPDHKKGQVRGLTP